MDDASAGTATGAELKQELQDDAGADGAKLKPTQEQTKAPTCVVMVAAPLSESPFFCVQLIQSLDACLPEFFCRYDMDDRHVHV